MAGELFIVQARPETVQSQKAQNILRSYHLSGAQDLALDRSQWGSYQSRQSPPDSGCTQTIFKLGKSCEENRSGLGTDYEKAAIVTNKVGVPAMHVIAGDWCSSDRWLQQCYRCFEDWSR